MPRSTLNAGGPRRKIPNFMIKRAAKYYNIHGWTKTAKRFKFSSTVMQKVARSNGVYQEKSDPERTGRSLYIAAKALERALMQHRKAGSPPSDIEHYAFFLLREILK